MKSLIEFMFRAKRNGYRWPCVYRKGIVMNQESIEYLKNFKGLLDEGLITQEEFEAKKAELLALDVEGKSVLAESSSLAENSIPVANQTPIGTPASIENQASIKSAFPTNQAPNMSAPQSQPQAVSSPDPQTQNTVSAYPLNQQYTSTTSAAIEQKGINQGNIALVVVGGILVVIGLFSLGSYAPNMIFGTDYFTAQYEATCHVAQAVCLIVAAIGSLGICLGVRGIYADQKKQK